LNKLFFDAINRVMVASGHMMKGGTIVDHPLFFFIQFHQPSSFPNGRKKTPQAFCTYGVGKRKRVLMFCISAPFEPATI